MPTPPNPNESFEIRLYLPSRVHARMREIQEAIGAPDLVTVIQNALAFYDSYLSEGERNPSLSEGASHTSKANT